MRKERLEGLTFEMPSDLLELISKEMKPERALTEICVVYSPTDAGTREYLAAFSSGEAGAAGYRTMARINLGMAEMGLSSDLFALEDYEDVLRDELDEPDCC